MSAVLIVPLRIILASFVAIVLAESADTEVYQKLIDRSWLVRVLGSNAVSIPLDTLLFNGIAFWGALPLATIASVMAGDIVIKTVVGAVTALYRSRHAEAAG
jgi:hypothetical protein